MKRVLTRSVGTDRAYFFSFFSGHCLQTSPQHLARFHQVHLLTFLSLFSKIFESIRLIFEKKIDRNQDTENEFTARIQELQNEVNCMNDSRDFQDAESVRSGQSHVTSQPAFFPPVQDPGGLRSRSHQLPDIWNSQGTSGNVFVKPTASSSSPYLGGFNLWISNVTKHVSPHVTSERQTPDTALDPRFRKYIRP